MNGRGTAGVNAAMRFMVGWMEGRKELDEQRKRQKFQQKIMGIAKSGEMEPTIKFDAQGNIAGVTFKPIKIKEEKEPSPMPWIEKAATKGYGEMRIPPRATTFQLGPTGEPRYGYEALAPAMREMGAMRLFGEREAFERARVAREKAKPKPTKPTFGQQQKIASLRAALRRGRVSTQTQFGEPVVFEIKSLTDALDVLSRANVDPSLFKEELEFYKDIVQTGKAPDGRTVAKLKDGRVIYLDTREEVR